MGRRTCLYPLRNAERRIYRPLTGLAKRKEEPEKGKSIISIGSTGVAAYKWVDEWRCDWLDFAEWSELFRWAYVYDLLPKEGE